jgi:hypothetical protein
VTIDEQLQALATAHKESDARWEARARELDAPIEASRVAREARMDRLGDRVDRLAESVTELKEAMIASAARENRHESRSKEHQAWLEASELLAARTERNLAEATERLNALHAILRDRNNGSQ